MIFLNHEFAFWTIFQKFFNGDFLWPFFGGQWVKGHSKKGLYSYNSDNPSVLNNNNNYLMPNLHMTIKILNEKYQNVC